MKGVVTFGDGKGKEGREEEGGWGGGRLWIEVRRKWLHFLSSQTLLARFHHPPPKYHICHLFLPSFQLTEVQVNKAFFLCVVTVEQGKIDFDTSKQTITTLWLIMTQD